MANGSLTEADNYSKEQRKHPLSADIDANRQQRKKKITAVIALTRGFKHAPSANIKTAVELAVPVLEEEFSGFMKANNIVKSKRLKLLFTKMDGDVALTDALQVIGIKSYFDEIRVLEVNLKMMVEERRSTKLEKKATSSNALFANSTSMLRKLLSTIETNALVETSKDFNPLISQLNAVIVEYKQVLQIRKVHKKMAITTNATAPAAATTGTVQNEVD